MTSFLKKGFFFLLILIPIYVGTIILLHFFGPNHLKLNIKFRKGGYGHLYTRLREADTTKNVDILVLGSSHAYRGFDPRIFEKVGFDMFNLGSSSQSHLQTEFLVKNYLPKLNPKIVLYEVYTYTFQRDGFESFIDLASNIKNPNKLFNMAVQINTVPAYNTWIAAMAEFYLGSDIHFKEELKKKEDTYISGGFIEQKFKTFKHSSNKFNDRNFEFDETQMRAFENTLKYLENEQIYTVLVQAPINSNYYLSIENREEFDSLFIKYERQGLVKSYMNFNRKQMNLSDELHFYDFDHLNQEGVEIFNRTLLEELKPE